MKPTHFGSVVQLIPHKGDAHHSNSVEGRFIHAVATAMSDEGLHRGVPQHIILGCPADKPNVGRLQWREGHVFCSENVIKLAAKLILHEFNMGF